MKADLEKMNQHNKRAMQKSHGTAFADGTGLKTLPGSQRGLTPKRKP